MINTIRKFVLLPLFGFLIIFPLSSFASNAELETTIKRSGNYRWGEGVDENDIAIAEKVALESLSQSIYVTISSSYEEKVRSTTFKSNSANLSQRSDSTVRNLQTFSSIHLRGVEKIILQDTKPIRVLAYIHKDSLAVSMAHAKHNIRSWYLEAVKAEKSGEIGDALRIYYWTYLRTFTLFDTLTLEIDHGAYPQVLLKERIETIISDLTVKADDCYNEMGVINAALQFSYLNIPVQSLDFTYYSGAGTDYGKVKNGRKSYIQLYYDPKRTGFLLPLNIDYAYVGEMRYDPVVEELYHIFSDRTFDTAIEVELYLPWNEVQDIISTQLDNDLEVSYKTEPILSKWSSSIQILSNIKGSSEFYESLSLYKQLQKLRVEDDASILLSNGQRIFAVVLNEKYVAALLNFTGEGFTDVRTGVVYKNLKDRFFGYHIIWIGENIG